jgi:hypothetical protein
MDEGRTMKEGKEGVNNRQDRVEQKERDNLAAQKFNRNAKKYVHLKDKHNTVVVFTTEKTKEEQENIVNNIKKSLEQSGVGIDI